MGGEKAKGAGGAAAGDVEVGLGEGSGGKESEEAGFMEGWHV